MTSTTELKVGCVVQGASSYMSQQGSVYAPGISAETVGSKGVFLGIVTIAPEGRTKAHHHEFHESAFYMMSGDAVELCTGSRLEHREMAHAGDYLFIPAQVPHVAVNRLPFSSVSAMKQPRRKAWSCCLHLMRSCRSLLMPTLTHFMTNTHEPQ